MQKNTLQVGQSDNIMEFPIQLSNDEQMKERRDIVWRRLQEEFEGKSKIWWRISTLDWSSICVWIMNLFYFQYSIQKEWSARRKERFDPKLQEPSLLGPILLSENDCWARWENIQSAESNWWQKNTPPRLVVHVENWMRNWDQRRPLYVQLVITKQIEIWMQREIFSSNLYKRHCEMQCRWGLHPSWETMMQRLSRLITLDRIISLRVGASWQVTSIKVSTPRTLTIDQKLLWILSRMLERS